MLHIVIHSPTELLERALMVGVRTGIFEPQVEIVPIVHADRSVLPETGQNTIDSNLDIRSDSSILWDQNAILDDRVDLVLKIFDGLRLRHFAFLQQMV